MVIAFQEEEKVMDLIDRVSDKSSTKEPPLDREFIEQNLDRYENNNNPAAEADQILPMVANREAEIEVVVQQVQQVRELGDIDELDEAGIDELMQQAHEDSDQSEGETKREEQSTRFITLDKKVSRGIFPLAKKVGRKVIF